MSKIIDKVNNFIVDNHMITAGDRIVLGLSGGADSVCLLLLLLDVSSKYGYESSDIFAVHINHMIRGQEADEDEEFARKLCQERQVNFVGFRKDIVQYAKELGLSVEEAGRKFRYQCFNEVAKENGCTRVAVAHNKNDMAETVIFNMLRGTGLKGMAGMQPVRGNIIRPILGITRDEIIEYLGEKQQTYRIDSTNEGLDYDRNKIRHIILPAMEDINKGAVGHICQMALEAGNSYSYIHNMAIEDYSGISSEDDFGKTVELDVNELYKYSPVLQEHLIHEAIGDVAGEKKDITRRHIVAVVGLLYQETGKQLELPYGIRARRSYDKLIITNKNQDSLDYNIKIEPDKVYNIPGQGIIEFKIIEYSDDVEISKKLYTKMLDYDKIVDALYLRTPEDGDYVVIDAKGSTKKLSRVFIDNKVDREKRGGWPVIASGKNIVWAVGLRFSEAYKVDEKTKRILYMDYKGKGED
ncbi:MAG: tRNA lysidine(34) synthetase TilS [Lachnospiraceae bacterium]|nr:tRNA lysidine(34) synthetase TilS [Lachnospiraceae bacterium]